MYKRQVLFLSLSEEAKAAAALASDLFLAIECAVFSYILLYFYVIGWIDKAFSEDLTGFRNHDKCVRIGLMCGAANLVRFGLCLLYPSDASVEKGNLFACQFHPEKSSEAGLKILENFVRLGREGN